MIGYGRMEMVKRGGGTRKAAYNGREEVFDERTGEVHDYSDREAPVHHEVMLPEEGPAYFSNVGYLWNAAEAAERRKDSQVAREMVLALPADAEFTHEDRVELARSFAWEHFVSKGLALQLDIHAPEEAGLTHEDVVELAQSFAREHFVSKGLAVELDIRAPDEEEFESKEANWHAHLLITTRRLGADGLDRLKARDLDPEVRRIGGRNLVVEGELWGELWRAHQERFCRKRGYDLRVDHNGLISENHIGARGMRRARSAPVLRLVELRKANREATFDVGQVLDELTRYNATFTARELDRLLFKQLRGSVTAKEDIAEVRAAVLAAPALIALLDPDTGEPSGRFTTRQVREEEQAAIAAAQALDDRKTGPVSAKTAKRVKTRSSLRPDQEDAFDYATGAGHLKLIAGRAGTGKSYTLSAIREAHERDGKRVIGLAPTNAVVRDMAADGFGETATLHSARFQLENGQMQWDRNTVVMVDEAAMIDTPILGKLLAAADQAGAKLILVGDDRQLPSIERGGMFPELLQRHDWAEITEVERQHVDWQRQAARDLAEYRFEDAVRAFERGRAITWSETREKAQDALVGAWKRDRELDREARKREHPSGRETPDETQFVFACTNADVDVLNAKLRRVYREEGELKGQDVVLSVCYRTPDHDEEEELHQVPFARGDRIQFTKTDKPAGLYNGDVGTITKLDPITGEISARIDRADGQGPIVTWNANAFNGFRHGYAGTIYKGQGKTLDRTYLYHSPHWTAASSYVALTRQRKSAKIFVSRKTAEDAKQLARQMARQEINSASLAWATQDDLDRRAGRHERAQPRPRGVGKREPEVKVEPGRERRGAGLHQDNEASRLATAQPSKQTLDLVAAWDRLIERYRTSLPGLEHSPDYEQARNGLRQFGEALAIQRTQLAALRKFDVQLGLDQRPALQRIANSDDPALETRALINDAERQQRRQTRDHQNRQQQARAQLRPRPRDPGSRDR